MSQVGGSARSCVRTIIVFSALGGAEVEVHFCLLSDCDDVSEVGGP